MIALAIVGVEILRLVSLKTVLVSIATWSRSWSCAPFELGVEQKFSIGIEAGVLGVRMSAQIYLVLS